MNKLRITINKDNHNIEYAAPTLLEPEIKYFKFHGVISKEFTRVNNVSLDEKESIIWSGDFASRDQTIEGLNPLIQIYLIVKGAINEYRLRSKNIDSLLEVSVEGKMIDDLISDEALIPILLCACGDKNILMNHQSNDSEYLAVINIGNIELFCEFGNKSDLYSEFLPIEVIESCLYKICDGLNPTEFMTCNAILELQFIALSKQCNEFYPAIRWDKDGWLNLELYIIGESEPIYIFSRFLLPTLEKNELAPIEKLASYSINQPSEIANLRKIALLYNETNNALTEEE